MGSALSSILLNFLGRKNSILLSGFIFFSSFLLIGLADYSASRDGAVLAGRALCGLGSGLGVPSTSIYIAETSSPGLRGKLSSLPALFLALGVLLGYLLGMDNTSITDRTVKLGNVVSGIFLAWDHLALACSVPGFLLITIIFLPESPSFLAEKGKDEKAVDALSQLKGISKDSAL